MVTEKRLATQLPISGLGEPLYFYRSIGSTNDRANELASEGATHGTLVVARAQTAGRGRGDREWFSKSGASLTFSVVLGPESSEVDPTSGLPVLGALAVVEALETLGIQSQIKWPNDVLIASRKVAGILVEASWMAEVLEYVVLGIGVNLKKSAIPKQPLDYPATCVDQHAQHRYQAEDLLVSILERLGKWNARLGSKEITMAWHRALAFQDEVIVLQGEGIRIEGTIKDLLPDGRLQVQTRDGEVFTAGTGELRLRPVDMPAS
jgi:BirA family biotin operon repressor/biotin-[acetyl-CoA-carboxylase] ligase